MEGDFIGRWYFLLFYLGIWLRDGTGCAGSYKHPMHEAEGSEEENAQHTAAFLRYDLRCASGSAWKRADSALF